MAKEKRIHLKASEYQPMLDRISLAAWLRAIAKVAVDGVPEEFEPAKSWVLKFGDNRFPHRAVLFYASKGAFTKENMDGHVDAEVKKRLEALDITTAPTR